MVSFHGRSFLVISFACALLGGYLSEAKQADALQSDGGGALCAGCTIVLGLLLNFSHPLPPDPPIDVEQTKQVDAVISEAGLLASLESVCSKHQSSLVCQGFKRIRADTTSSSSPTPDTICRDINLCTNKTCNLYPQNNSTGSVVLDKHSGKEDLLSFLSSSQRVLIDSILSGKLWEAWNVPTKDSKQHTIKEGQRSLRVQATFQPSPPSKPEHLPLVDEDEDRFSTWPYLRGSDWRGKDCNDSDSSIYPGRVPHGNPQTDSNCNGISGVNPDSNQPYEDELCSGTDPRGVAILGDSAGAHFGLPTPRVLNSVDAFLHMALNELDWPQCSWATGFEPENATSLNTSICEASHLPMISFYQRMKERNRCIHRDFQNIAVNGARTTSMYDSGIVEGLARNASTDNPLLVFYALVGNDVCNPHPGSGHMTSPAQFKFKVLEALRYLDSGVLPKGSHVVFVGVLNGMMMWDTMSNLTHPDLAPVKYATLWEYLSCLEANPCWGYLNPDFSWRNYTLHLARQQNQQYKDIIEETQPNGGPNKNFSSFDLTYLDYPINESTVKWWESLGPNYHGYNLFESVGGGHPSQTAHMLTSKWIWEELDRKRPDILGPVNPHNERIQKLFGNQGGY